MPIVTLDDYVLVTSNAKKLAEFARFGLPLRAEKGADLPEVQGSAVDVIKHKALAAGAGRIVEDTSFAIHADPALRLALGLPEEDTGTEIRWLLEKWEKEEGALKAWARLHGCRATWTVLLGVHAGDTVEVCEGVVDGVVQAPWQLPDTPYFGFDPFFAPDGAQGRTLHDLELAGLKDTVSARRAAVEALLEGRTLSFPVADIAPWQGGWQHSR